MPTVPKQDVGDATAQPHRARQIAESFGLAPGRYDRARPGYPDQLVARVVAGSPGRQVLDVGCGTGIAARQFQAAGCAVLGVEPDARMADFARSRGLPVEVATFENWEPAGRMYDALIAAQSWHWVEPVAGAAKAAQVLRAGGRLAIFSHVYEPPAEVAEPFAAAFRRVVPDSPFANAPARRPLEAYEALFATFGAAIRDTEQFGRPEQWRFDWPQIYSRDQWLELLPTTGSLTQLPADKTEQILADVGAAIDLLGGHFTMDYVTLAISAIRSGG
jgi:SAM-dependent methyltransferase